MIGDNIKRFRKAKGMSQEEMAAKLYVVRQTVSKWESGLSVPDADVLARAAELLEVPVWQLLGTREESGAGPGLSEELARLNEQLAGKCERERQVRRANGKRGAVLALSFLALLLALAFENEAVSAALAATCMLAAVAVLYRNLALLTSITAEDLKLGALRAATAFDAALLLFCVVFALLTAAGVIGFSENEEKMLAMAVVAGVMLFAGLISPRLPFSKHTGLRLPWTVRDEGAWNVAHRAMGWASPPAAVLYIACALTLGDFEAVTLVALLVWLGVPAAVSYIYIKKR